MKSTIDEKPLILIVDDNNFNLEMLSSVLKEEGYHTLTASSGIEALDSADKKSPDLILLDIIMPQMDGYETCERLRESDKTKNVPIIFLSGRTKEDDVVRGFRAGAVDYVSKPFHPEELLSRVRTHLELGIKTRQLQLASEENKELLQMVCHDLVNPLSFIKYIVDVESEFPDIYEEMKGNIGEAVESGLNIIEMVRRIRKLNEGREVLNMEEVGLKAAVEESIFMLKQKVEEKDLEVTVDIEDKLTVTAEKNSLVSTVLNNIMTNAIKFSHDRSKIIIDARDEDDRIILSIKDKGIGMSEKLLGDIFDINKATNRKGTRGEGGTGYGLPLVLRFITAFGGFINVTSKEDKSGKGNSGTTVELAFRETL